MFLRIYNLLDVFLLFITQKEKYGIKLLSGNGSPRPMGKLKALRTKEQYARKCCYGDGRYDFWIGQLT
jgi:hypothetical protein